jgi:Flp pilus assembly pilin Flp
MMGLLRREEGQDLIEYALLGGLIAAAILGASALFTDQLEAMVDGIGECIDFDSVACGGPF